MRWYYMLAFFGSISLIVAITWYLQFQSEIRPLSITLQKTVFQEGEELTITLKNNSNEDVVFNNTAYELVFHFHNETSLKWEYYATIPSVNLSMILHPGSWRDVRYRLGSDVEAPFTPGLYRVGVVRYDLYKEFEVQPSGGSATLYKQI